MFLGVSVLLGLEKYTKILLFSNILHFWLFLSNYSESSNRVMNIKLKVTRCLENSLSSALEALRKDL